MIELIPLCTMTLMLGKAVDAGNTAAGHRMAAEITSATVSGRLNGGLARASCPPTCPGSITSSTSSSNRIPLTACLGAGDVPPPGLVGLAGKTGTELVKPDQELGDKSRQDGRLRSIVQQPSVNCRSQP